MLLVELCLIVWGIFIIGTNRVSVFRFRVVRGRPATIIGWLLLAPIGVGLFIGCQRVYALRKLGRTPDLSAIQELAVDIAIVELIATGFTLLMCFIIFCCYAERPGGFRPSWEGDDYQRWGGGASGPSRGTTKLNSEELFRPQ